jgi:hypothetical protein
MLEIFLLVQPFMHNVHQSNVVEIKARHSRKIDREEGKLCWPTGNKNRIGQMKGGRRAKEASVLNPDNIYTEFSFFQINNCYGRN